MIHPVDNMMPVPTLDLTTGITDQPHALAAPGAGGPTLRPGKRKRVGDTFPIQSKFIPHFG